MNSHRNLGTLLVALPRSGSTWLFRCIQECLGESQCAREFFNPLLNEKHRAHLVSAFGADGCSMHLGDRYPIDHLTSLHVVINIFSPVNPALLTKAIEASWCQEQFRFSKEVWMTYKLDTMINNFYIFSLIRETELTFPGSYPPLNTLLYLRLYESLLHNFCLLSEGVKACVRFLLENSTTTTQKICGTHFLCTTLLRKDCERLGIPLLNYRNLLTADLQGLVSMIREAWPKFPDVGRLAMTIERTRAPVNQLAEKTAVFKRLGEEEFFNRFRECVNAYLNE